MAVTLYLAPAAAGKSAYLLQQVRQTAQNLQAMPLVCVPSRLQLQSWQQRLAHSGGAMGVRVVTFAGLIETCLSAAGAGYTHLTDPVRYRLLRAVVDDIPLHTYAAIRTRPGFIQVLRRLIDELKVAQISPAAFAQAVTAMNAGPRLTELADIYQAYQTRLHAKKWADSPELGRQALALLQNGQANLLHWPLLAVDGFDNFTSLQLALLHQLAPRVEHLLITLTGQPDGPPRPAHNRFATTLARLQETFQITPQPLPLPPPPNHRPSMLTHLEKNLFERRPSIAPNETVGAVDNATPSQPPPKRGRSQNLPPQRGAIEGGENVVTHPLTLIAAPDQPAEVRAALRWLKQQAVQQQVPLSQLALLARSITPYRPFIVQTAAEFGLPLRLLDGLPLKRNPAIAALLNLLRLSLPLPATANNQVDASPQPTLPRRALIEAWRSPYFDWQALPTPTAETPIGIRAGDADRLDAAARFGRVIRGEQQWQEMFAALVALTPTNTHDENYGPAALPTGDEAAALHTTFNRFVQRLHPPAGQHSYRHFVQWLEQLIGNPDPGQNGPTYSLRLAERVLTDAPNSPDSAALHSLKDVLRGLVWAEEILDRPETIDYPRFLQELEGALEAAVYRPPTAGGEALLVADVIQARGVPFTAVALLGLAEGEFPQTISEDTFLREKDRQTLRDDHHLPLDSSIQSAEREFFYETITRPQARLLLTRPRLTDSGAPWEPSPFWEDVVQLSDVTPQTLSSQSMPAAHVAASPVELLETLAAAPKNQPLHRWAAQYLPGPLAAVEAAGRLLTLRYNAAPSPFDGHLTDLNDKFSRRFAPTRPWSASRLEQYRTCPFMFFVASVLRLEPKSEPAAGLEAWQLGNIYHNIFEQVYQAPTVSDPTDAAQLLAALDEVAAPILAEAPAREGFRATAWWEQTKDEIVETVRRSLLALAELTPAYTPRHFEAEFKDELAVTVTAPDGDSFKVRGKIDRIDVGPDGSLRLIDYKTSGPYRYTLKALVDGKLLQLPLYALAARDALKLGQPVDGFYWHIRQAQASSFSLSAFDHGPDEAIELATAHAWEAVTAARQGRFSPQVPPGGCPTYCPAAAFCWRYQPGF